MPTADLSEVKASLAISGDDLSFEHCSDVVGVEPTRQFIRKFDYDSSQVPAREWSFSVSVLSPDSLGDAVDQLLSRVPIRPEHIRAEAERCGWSATIVCSVRIHGLDRPVYRFSPRTLEKIVRMNAGLSLDIYDYSE